MFNLSGSEIVFILLAGLVILGPEKLPGAIRQVGRVYSELRRMGQGFQDELRASLDEPMRELRETADLARSTLTKPLGDEGPDLSKVTPTSISASVQRVLEGNPTPPPSAPSASASVTNDGAGATGRDPGTHADSVGAAAEGVVEPSDGSDADEVGSA